MRVTLVSVPHAAPFSPLLGAPLVAAGLIQRGHQAVLIDGALLALERLWSPAALQAGATALREQLARHERRDEMSRSAAREYLESARQLLGAEVIAAAVPAALAHLRGGAAPGEPFADGAAYDRALQVVEAALRLACAPYAPERVTLRSYHPGMALRTEAALLAHAKRPPASALFGPTLHQDLPSAIFESHGGAGPEVLGISLSWPSQLGPAAALSLALRSAGFAGPIVWGGALMAHLGPELARGGQLASARLFDALVPFGGAEVLAALLEAHAAGHPLAVPGVLVPGATAPAACPEPAAADGGGAQLPLPRFDDLPLERYLSPRPVLPLLSSLGCYYQRCAFCDHFHSLQRFRRRPGAAVVEEMRQLHAQTGCRDFYLVDDCTPPRTLRELAVALRTWRSEGGPSVGWMTECRAERGLLAEGLLEQLAAAGCRMLLFGVESGSDAVLAAMEKGLRGDQQRAVLRAAHAAGILTWCFYMVGFPGETEASARETLAFLLEERDSIDVVAGGPFVLTRHSPVARDPGRFGLEVELAASAGVSKKRRKKGRAVASGVDVPAPARPPDLALQLGFRGASLGEAAQERALRAILEHEQLQHLRHPLVVEAHALFLPRDYYRADAQRQTASGPVAAPDRRGLLGATVRPAPGLAVQYFKFPTSSERLPASGKIRAEPGAVLSLFGAAALHVSLPVGALAERCRAGAVGVARLVRDTEARGEGMESDVLEAVAHLVEGGYLLLEG